MNLGSIAGNTRAYQALSDRLAKQDTATASKKSSAGGAAPRTPKYAFDPFDQKTWDVKAKDDAKKTTKADDSKGTTTGTGVVVPKPKYRFDPFDQKTWDVKAPKGSRVDTHA
jgi:hypothetical protein